MQKPGSSTPVDRLSSLALYFGMATKGFVELMEPSKAVRAKLLELGKAMEAAIKPVAGRQADLVEAVRACVGPRVQVRLVDLKADEVVRSVQRGAEEAGVADQVFPDGITPIVKPVGQSEIDAITALVARIDASKWDDKKAQAKRLNDVNAQYTAALGKRRDAVIAVGQARALRDSAKEDFLDVYAAITASVAALFPRDRAQQDVFFDDVRASAADDTGTETPAAPVPAS